MKRMDSYRHLLDSHTIPSDDLLANGSHDGTITCLACSHTCTLSNGKRGACRIRFNDNGALRVPFGYVAGLAVDPIEKKPFFHAYCGHDALSFGMLGCNFTCPFCQNWISSQTLKDARAGAQIEAISAEKIVRIATARRARAVVSTYNEPVISSEWAHAVFSEAKRFGLSTGFVSNGFATQTTLRYLDDVLDMMNVDLKCFDESGYRALGGRLQPVLDTIRTLHDMGKWVEVVTLLVPGFNDSDDEIRRITDFVASVDPLIPWHVSAFRAQYKMLDGRDTTAGDLLRAIDIAVDSGLKYIYSGNMPGETGEWENTRCHHCDETLIRRNAYFIRDYRITPDGRCPDCGTHIPGLWSADGKSGGGVGVPRIV